MLRFSRGESGRSKVNSIVPVATSSVTSADEENVAAVREQKQRTLKLACSAAAVSTSHWMHNLQPQLLRPSSFPGKFQQEGAKGLARKRAESKHRETLTCELTVVSDAVPQRRKHIIHEAGGAEVRDICGAASGIICSN